MKHLTNAQLEKYRAKSGWLASTPSTSDRLFRFLTQLALLALWKSLAALSVPFGKLFAVYFWMGKSVFTLSVYLERQLLKAVGWMSGTAFTREHRIGRLSHHYFAADVKRWHVGLGM